MENIKEEAKKYALQNAVLHDGSAQPGAVIGKLLAGDPDLKKDMASISKIAAQAVNEINDMPQDEQKKLLGRLAPELLEKNKESRRDLPELRNAVKGKVITRIPPEPSKYLHIGHALSFLINYMYAKKYEGKCVLRFEDTNPSLTSQEYVDAIKEDLDYLEITPDRESLVSDDMEKLYAKAQDLISSGMCYVCFCTREVMQDLRHKGSPCACRAKLVNKNRAEWENMKSGLYKEGEAVLRLRGDLSSENQVMRDPVLFRITFESHFIHGKKYAAWPLYDFENAIEDSEQGITHILRSSEFGSMRIELQNTIKDLLRLPKQEIIQYGRFNVSGAVTQGRVIREQIDSGELTGWDDPRLVTLRALKRRGILPKTYRELAINAGLSKNQTTIDWTMIAAINRKLLDKVSSRYFFVPNPMEITVEGAPERTVEIRHHPDLLDRGSRSFKTSGRFLIDREDLDGLEDGALIRIMDCMNFSASKGKYVFQSLDIASFRKSGSRIIQWLPADAAIDIKVLMPDGTFLHGMAEIEVNNLKVDEIVQFVRFGFCRVDKVDGGIKLVFCHN